MEYSRKNRGYNNGAAALRSPGSTLKPFLYAQALDSGFNAANILEDVRRSYAAPKGVYIPANFNRRNYGPVSMREALGNSLNQSAIFLLNRIGYNTFYRTLTSLGLINYPEHGPNYYGLGLVVGNPEVTLLELVAAYSALSNGGVYRSPQFYIQKEKPPEHQVFSREASFIVTDILSDPGARVLTFGDFFNQKLPFKMAIKTGTSTHSRDAWIVGYTQKYTVGIWVGNFNGKPTKNLSGASAGGAILGETMEVLHPNGNSGILAKPKNVIKVPVCSISGMKPLKTCPHIKHEYFISGIEPKEPCTFHAQGGQLHNLPAPFAGWLDGKHQRGSAGRFRLAGFDPQLEKTFNNTDGSELLSRKHFDARERMTSSNSKDKIQITNPVNLDEFILTHGQRDYQIVLRARVRQPFPAITWHIDGIEYAKVGPPYEASWTLKKGVHEITAVSPFGQGDSVTVLVD
jgi:penicillin-binding protein 1C